MKEGRSNSLRREGAAGGDGSDLTEEWEPKDNKEAYISTCGVGRIMGV